jgi:hypothetical protein
MERYKMSGWQFLPIVWTKSYAVTSRSGSAKLLRIGNTANKMPTYSKVPLVGCGHIHWSRRALNLLLFLFLCFTNKFTNLEYQNNQLLLENYKQ